MLDRLHLKRMTHWRFHSKFNPLFFYFVSQRVQLLTTHKALFLILTWNGQFCIFACLLCKFVLFSVVPLTLTLPLSREQDFFVLFIRMHFKCTAWSFEEVPLIIRGYVLFSLFWLFIENIWTCSLYLVQLVAPWSEAPGALKRLTLPRSICRCSKP